MGVIWGFIASHVDFLATCSFFWSNRYANLFLSRKCPFQQAFYLYHCYFSGIKRLSFTIITQEFTLIFI